MEMVELMFTT